VLAEFAFTTMRVDHLEARIALRNRRAHAAMQRLGARPGSVVATPSPMGIPRDPELAWNLRGDDWLSRVRDPRMSAHDARQRMRKAVEAAESELRQSESPETVEPYPLFMFDRRRREMSRESFETWSCVRSSQEQRPRLQGRVLSGRRCDGDRLSRPVWLSGVAPNQSGGTAVSKGHAAVAHRSWWR
jgi:hypothetical protein